jgi:phage/plasmid-like protein (TIGR03299 family)
MQGVSVEGVQRGQETLELAKLDNWNLQLEPIFSCFGAIETHRALVRHKDEKIISVVGDGYQIFHNEKLALLGDAILQTGDAKYETAGSLCGGKVVWLLAKIGEDVTIDGTRDEKIRPYLLLSTGHDGFHPTQCATVTERVVCHNTFNVAMKGAIQKFSVRHTLNADDRLKFAQQALGIHTMYLKMFKLTAQDLLSKAFTEAEMIRLTHSLMIPNVEKPSTKAMNQVEGLLKVYRESENIENCRGTQWGGLMAVGEYLDHYLPTRNDSDNHAMSILEGTIAKKKQMALCYLQGI